MEKTSELNLKQIFQTIRHWAWLLALGCVLVGLASFLVSRNMQPVYEASTTLLVVKAPETNTADYTSLSDYELMLTYVQMMTARPVLDAVSSQLGLEVDEGSIKVENVTDTQLIEVRVEDTDPQRAADIANLLVEKFIGLNDTLQSERFSESETSLQQQIQAVEAQIDILNADIDALEAQDPALRDQDRLDQTQNNLALYQQIYSNLLSNYENIRLANLRSTNDVLQVEPSIVPEYPVRPSIFMNTALGFIAGLLLAAVVVFLIEYLDTSIKTEEEVKSLVNLPVIGYIGETKRGAPADYVAEHPRSPIAEAFRTLRTNLDFVAVDKPLQTLLIASSNPVEGKSTVAVNLAITLAQSGRSTLLIDADLRRPRVHRYLDLPNSKGLSDLFREAASIKQVMRTWPKNEKLKVVTSGGLPPNPTDLFASEKMIHILKEARDSADMVVVDAPPFLVADPSVLASRVDGVLIVIQPGKTERETAKVAVSQLMRAGAHIVGVVFNRIPRNRPSYYGGAHGYYSGKSGYHHYYSERESG